MTSLNALIRVLTSSSEVIEVGRPLEAREPEKSIIAVSSSSAGVRWGEFAGLKPKFEQHLRSL